MLQVIRMNQRSAFTLIEMVVALVLASIMTVGLLRIVSVVSRETTQLRTEQTDYVAAGFLADRLREDLVNARGIKANASSLVMAGFVTGANIAGTVQYQSMVIGNRKTLVRRTGNRSEVMWVDFGGFMFESFEQVDAETPLPDATGGLPVAPSRFAIGVSDQNGRVLFREVIHHHAS